MSEGTAGYIDVTSPLFGSDEGQRIASLVLSSGGNVTNAGNSSFVLNASNGTRTEIYLVPSNSSNFVADSTDASLIEVTLKVPVFNPLTAATVPYCASFDPNPPSPCPLSVQKCGAADSEHLSQRFVYSPSTGVIRPLWAVGSNGTTSATGGNSTTAPSAKKRDYVVQAAMVKANAANATSSSVTASSTASASASSTPLPSSSSVASSAASSSSVPTSSSSASASASASLVAAAAAAAPTASSSSPANVQPAQSVSLVFTPVNPAAVLSVDASLGISKGGKGSSAPAPDASSDDESNGEEDEGDDAADAESVPTSTAAPEASSTDAPVPASDSAPSSTSSSLPPLATPVDSGAPYS